jgi:hypothetical protein
MQLHASNNNKYYKEKVMTVEADGRRIDESLTYEPMARQQTYDVRPEVWQRLTFFLGANHLVEIDYPTSPALPTAPIGKDGKELSGEELQDWSAQASPLNND